MKKKTLEHSRRLRGLFYVLPCFVFHFILIIIPALSLIYYSFTKWNGLGEPQFIGAGNFVKAFTGDPVFLQSLWHNVEWTIFFCIVPVLLAIVASLLMVRLKKSQMAFRSLIFLPYVMSPLVAGCIFSYMYSPLIGVASIFEKLGITSLSTFAPLGDTNMALYAVAGADAWHFWGFAMVILLAALHQVDNDLYEVADLEGCNALQKFVHVTLPSIAPTLAMIYMYILINSFLTFDYVYVMTNGGPSSSTEIAATWIYKLTFVSYDAGYGSAMSLVVCAICVLIYFLFQIVQNQLKKKDVTI